MRNARRWVILEGTRERERESRGKEERNEREIICKQLYFQFARTRVLHV